MLLAIVAALVTGVLLSVQSRANGELSGYLHAAIEAALVSFGSGLVICTLITLCSPRTRAGLRRVRAALRDGALRWPFLLGGVCGALFVGTQTSAVPQIGVAVFTVVSVGGQTLSALLVDKVGLGPGGRSPITALRVAAAAVAVIGVGVAATAGDDHLAFAAAPLLLTLAVGVLQAVQQATNGRVNAAAGYPMATTWLNFVLGTLTLLVLAAVEVWLGRTRLHPLVAAPFWVWIGGICGVGFIALAAWAVHHVGVLIFGLVGLASQLVTALVLDLLSPAARGDVGAQLMLGMAVTLIASGAAAWSRRPSARR